MARLHAGAARVKLEPPLGIAMAGYGRRVGRASGVHDDLAAQAVVISDGTGKIAIVSVDLLAIGIRIADQIREAVAAKSDIAADAIMICATHTHSAPLFNIFATPSAETKAGDDRDLDWERALPDKIVRVVLEANRRLEPASIRVASARFTLGTNRRLRRADGSIQNAPNYAGVADSEALALGVYSDDAAPIAILFNYPCHGVVLCEDNLLYSRDWPGFAADEIESTAEGEGAIAMFLQGATGNIDPRSRGSFEVAREHGTIVGRAVLSALALAQSIEDARVAFRRAPITLKLRQLDDLIADARRCAAQTQASLNNHRGGEGIQLKRLRDQHELSLTQLAAIEMLEEQNRRDRRVDVARREIATALTLITIGGVAIAGIPGELFVELGLALKANPLFDRTFVAGYCNDLAGYIPTREAYAQGGYEVDTSRVAAGSGEAIVAKVLDSLAALRSESRQ
ncbi:MAG TPA: neutral/alkaline non-lysosomal ceramidase N-terminal domain-containing protein [Candidatus Binataceae bacterium]|nr:neutral/alkaline non-lysosomal ceramidase N-terminal domain-containing protein [Candidatus Binataceae bacterium]